MTSTCTVDHIQSNLQWKQYHDELKTEIPQREDLNSAASGLIRLQEIYRLYPEDITSETSLNADEAYHVGLVAYNEGKFQHAFLWFLHSLNRLTAYSSNMEEELLHYLNFSAYYFGSLPQTYFGQQPLNLGPTNDRVRLQLKRLQLQTLT